jgi:hypothetical protein
VVAIPTDRFEDNSHPSAAASKVSRYPLRLKTRIVGRCRPCAKKVLVSHVEVRGSDCRKELRDTEADTQTTTKMLMATKNKALLTHLDDLEKRQEVIELELDQLLPPLIELHPDIGEIYRKKVRDLKAYLAAADDDNRADAYEAIRELIEKVVVNPRGGAYQGYDIEVHGQLAVLLDASRGGTIQEPPSPKSMGVLVAGVGFEPTTFRL